MFNEILSISLFVIITLFVICLQFTNKSHLIAHRAVVHISLCDCVRNVKSDVSVDDECHTTLGVVRSEGGRLYMLHTLHVN